MTGTSDDTHILLLILVLELLALVVITFGWKRSLVAAEAFFIMAGFATVRASRLFGSAHSDRLSFVLDSCAVGVGLAAGLLAAYLIVTEGGAITDWVTHETKRMIASLFASLLVFGVVEGVWRLIVDHRPN